MKVILTVENRNGMLFNHRRVSRDQKVCERILAYCKGQELWMNAYSGKLFDAFDTKDGIHIAEDFLEQFPAICFVEDQDITPWLSRIDTIVLFRWNRDYPADFFFRTDLSSWTMTSREEFPGKSHDLITMEVYEK